MMALRTYQCLHGTELTSELGLGGHVAMGAVLRRTIDV